MPTLKKPIKEKKRQIRREERQEIYQSERWQKLRQAKLMEQPLCEMCLQKGITKPAEDVHHIDSFLNYTGNQRLFKAYDYNNLMSLCKECHSEIHKQKQ